MVMGPGLAQLRGCLWVTQPEAGLCLNTSLGTMDVNAVDWQGTGVSGDICVNVDVV